VLPVAFVRAPVHISTRATTKLIPYVT